MKNKPRNLKQYIEYRNMLVTRRASRELHHLKPLDGKEDYYTIRLRELDNQIEGFKGIGHVKLKDVK